MDASNPSPQKKRKTNDNNAIETSPQKLSPLQQVFDGYRVQIDARNDKRERIIKISRDITRFSKKAIVTLQQATQSKSRASTVAHARKHLETTVCPLIGKLHLETQDKVEYYRNQRSFTGGLQEFIEALSFLHYLESGELLSFELTQTFINENLFPTSKNGEEKTDDKHDGPRDFVVTEVDYVLGILDLAGELMRFATTAVSSGMQDEANKICSFLQDFYAGIAGLEHFHHKEAKKKIEVIRQSLVKVEALCGKLRMQMREFPEIPEHILKLNLASSKDSVDDQ